VTLTGPDLRVLQVHPGRGCNLRCLHCYSSSAPEERAWLDPALLCRAIADSEGLGYNMLSISGGEPLLYRGLTQLLEQAHRHGMLTSLITNGMLLTAERLSELKRDLDVIAISMDGAPQRHNRMRAHARAFQVMESRLGGLRESGIPFGFVFTLASDNLHELEWAARFAVEQGAMMLQVHPLEEVGRAKVSMRGAEPVGETAALAWLVIERLKEIWAGRLAIHLDLFDRGYAASEAASLDRSSCALSNLISPLVIEADGTVSPLRYGFPREWQLGNILDAPLSELAEAWNRGAAASFASMCRDAITAPETPDEFPLINIYDSITRRADGARTLLPLSI
jgi:Fe-coproporphyrin III synthase